MICRVDPFQLDAEVIQIFEDKDAIPDPADQRIDIRSNLVLEVGRIPFKSELTDEDEILVQQTPLNEDQLETSIVDSSNLGQELIIYATISSSIEEVSNDGASIGDYMQIRLIEDIESEVFSTFA